MNDINEEKQQRVGVFVARFQPLHKAHMYVIEKALKECDKVVIVLGSSNKQDMLRNPFSFELRKELLAKCLQNSKDLDRIEVFELPDWSQENIQEDNAVWGHYLYYNVVSRIKQKHFSIYYSDSPDIIKSWFDDEVAKYVDFRLLDRSKVFEGLSATKIRNAMLNFTPEDQKYLKQFLPAPVFDKIEELRKIWINVHESPKSDFSMQ